MPLLQAGLLITQNILTNVVISNYSSNANNVIWRVTTFHYAD